MSKSDQALRFLGFAFASADLLFEIDHKGVIGLVLGAAKKVTGVGNVTLPQSSWKVLFEPVDYGIFAALINSLDGNGRKGPVRCRLRDVPGKPPRFANVYAFRLPQLEPNISCALSLSLEAPSQAAGAPRGLMNRTAFDAAATRLLADARASGVDVELALVDLVGLKTGVAKLNEAGAEAVMDGLSDILCAEALHGVAANLEAERFAVMRETSEGPDTLPGRLKAAAAEGGVDVAPACETLPLNGVDASQALRALRFTLDHFVKAGAVDGDLKAVFKAGLDTTIGQAKAFTAMVKSGGFKMVYQPIIDLKTKQTNHYEALVRFPDQLSPAQTIVMAEELDLIDVLDLAVVERVIKTLRSHGPEVKIAVNVSGRSFLRPKFLDRVLALTAGDIRLKGRLLFEITESAALANLDLAEERIQRLRREGFQVCLDDFGAGSASLSYLRNLTVDVVKIDGQYVRQLESTGRDGAVIRHLTALCQELRVRTIGEMVESQKAADLLKEFGVDMAQGFALGEALEQIPVAAPPVARRRGAVESWG
jgi:EAL domain-containing protein (putative c-di-GMP-specific phosphodiesterase class I)/GGDEF domain-containing protein